MMLDNAVARGRHKQWQLVSMWEREEVGPAWPIEP
jgi:hypothetical protein